MTERDIIKAIDANTFEQVSFAPVTTWVDGTPMDDSKCDGVIYKKLVSGGYVGRNFHNDLIPVERFGAKGDGVTDDTTAIQAAINFACLQSSLKTGYVSTANPLPTVQLNSLRGYVIKDTITINQSINFENKSQIYYQGANDRTALLFKRDAGSLLNMSIELALFGNNPLDATSDSYQGVVIQNIQSSIIRIKQCTYFTRGVVLYASDNLGFSWNKIYLGKLYSNLESLIIKSETLGWPNANIVYGGNFGASSNTTIPSTITRSRSYIKGESDGAYYGNSWLFQGQQLEGGINTSGWNGFETIAFNFKNFLCGGFSFQEYRIEQVNSRRVGLFKRDNAGAALGSITFNSGQYVENNVMLYDDDITPVYTSVNYQNIVDTGSTINYAKKTKTSRYFKKYETIAYDTIFGLSTGYTNNAGVLIQCSGLSPIMRLSSQTRIRFTLFDQNFNQIDNTTGLLTAQLGWMSNFSFSAAKLVNLNFIQFGSNVTGFNAAYTKIIPEAYYVFFFTPPDKNGEGWIKVDIEYTKIETIKYIYKNQFVKEYSDAYIIPSTIDSLIAQYEIGERYYSIGTNVLYEVITSGMNAAYNNVFTGNIGDTVLTWVSGTIQNMVVGNEFTFDNDPVTTYRVVANNTTTITIDKPLVVAVTSANHTVNKIVTYNIVNSSASVLHSGLVNKSAALTAAAPTTVTKTSPVAAAAYAQADIQKMVDDITALVTQLNATEVRLADLIAKQQTAGQQT